jgi:hypothetical protein
MSERGVNGPSVVIYTFAWLSLAFKLRTRSWIYEISSYLDHDATLLACGMEDSEGLGDLGVLTLK